MKIALTALAATLIASSALAQATTPMPAMSAQDHATMSKTVEGSGVVQGVNEKAGTITLHHGPIAALKWPAMTMTFKASPEVLKAGKPGQKVRFSLDTAADNKVIALKSN